MKIGGGILKDKESFGRIAGILEARKNRENIIVISALHGITDLLLEACEKAKKGEENIEVIAEEIRKRHLEIVNGNASEKFEMKMKRLKRLLYGINYIQEISPEVREVVLSFGERLSALIMAEFLNSKGIESIPLESEDAGIVSDGKTGHANCIINKTRENFESKVIPVIKAGKTAIITGFYGIDENGKVNTFGRGGSDYSAGVAAVCADASILEIWKDVAGFLTADPRMVKEARKLEVISFDEAEELGYFGAKILHPRTMDVLRMKENVYAEIKSVFHPEEKGTIIARESTQKKTVTALASKKDIAVVTVEGGMMADAPGVALAVFSKMAENGIPIDAIATAQTNISFTIDPQDVYKAKGALMQIRSNIIEKYKVDENRALVGVVGQNMRHTRGVAARVFSAVAKEGINLEMISQGASEIDLSFVIRSEYVEKAVNAVHKEFELEKE